MGGREGVRKKLQAVLEDEGVMEGGEIERERRRDTNSPTGLLSGSIMFGELLSTPVWQVYHRGRNRGRGRTGGRESKKRRVEKASLSASCHLFLQREGIEADGSV